MDRASITERLALAERHVAESAVRIQRQRELHAELARDGHAETAAQALSLLGQFEELQAVMVADLDRFKEELASKTGA